ncbi:methyltransferase domain-containing protein [Candidatus Desantisbacteria bacterium]|nr:methyltransferase domain-containing protein [Candidatus Desantisbacteria bacterium]
MIKPIDTFKDLIDTSWGFRISKIIFTAIELNLFTLLCKEKIEREKILKKLKLLPSAGEYFLNSLVSLGLLEKKNNKYTNSRISNKFLAKQSGSYRGDILKHFHSGWDNWANLEEVLYEKKSTKRQKNKDDNWRSFILGMRDLGIERAEKMLSLIDFSQNEKILDLGGGPGIYSIIFAKKFSGLTADIFDLPETIKIAGEIIKNYKLEKRISTVKGNFVSDELGSGYTMVLVSNIIHSYGTNTNHMILKKVFKSLSKGGRVVISDFILDEEKTSPLQAVLFGMHMIVNTEEGRTYTGSEVESLLKKSGFNRIEFKRLDENTKLAIGYK